MQKNSIFQSATLLLPDFSEIDGKKWATIACDQFTSEPAYWEKVASFVQNAPSTLSLILPEVYLGERKDRIPAIHRAMEEALSFLVPYPDAMVALCRTQSDGRVRRGIVGIIDLEAYDYGKDSTSLIRASEETVIERIPPRVEIRRGAPLELPHVMLLVDDPERTVVEPAILAASSRPPLYDFDLMEDGGQVTGRLLSKEEQASVLSALDALSSMEQQRKKYGEHLKHPLLFAVGDGNHSLAAAKAAYEECKEALGATARNHPLRYALVEIVNLYDPALTFEPIYRVAFGCNPEDLLHSFRTYAGALSGDLPAQTVIAVIGNKKEQITLPHPTLRLTVGTLQAFLDSYIEKHPGVTVDYIHDEDSLLSLASKKDAVGFLLDGMKKEDLFRSIALDGPLPRKTFSMGHARDKRYYLECRKIK